MLNEQVNLIVEVANEEKRKIGDGVEKRWNVLRNIPYT